MPGMAETELSLTPLFYGVPLKLVFEKTAGQRINAVALLGDPDSLVSIEPADPATLTAATEFTVRATVTDPVESASGNVGAAFGLSVDCSSLAARDFQNSLFVTDMHWLDIDPPTIGADGLAGLRAHGDPGTEATFDGIFAPAFLTAMGFTDFSQVQGYVDLTAVTGWSGAALTRARRRRRQPLAGRLLEVPGHQQQLVHAQHPVRPPHASGQGRGSRPRARSAPRGRRSSGGRPAWPPSTRCASTRAAGCCRRRPARPPSRGGPARRCRGACGSPGRSRAVNAAGAGSFSTTLRFKVR